MWRRLFSSPHLKTLSSSTLSHSHPRSTAVPLRFASLSRTVATQSGILFLLFTSAIASFINFNSFFVVVTVAGSIKKRVEDVVPIATGHEREEIQADLEVLLYLSLP